MKNFLKELVSVVPSKRQLDWYDVGFYAFVHFGVNTFTELEWVEYMPNLKYLILAHTTVTDISSLATCKQGR